MTVNQTIELTYRPDLFGYHCILKLVSLDFASDLIEGTVQEQPSLHNVYSFLKMNNWQHGEVIYERKDKEKVSPQSQAFYLKLPWTVAQNGENQMYSHCNELRREKTGLWSLLNLQTQVKREENCVALQTSKRGYLKSLEKYNG